MATKQTKPVPQATKKSVPTSVSEPPKRVRTRTEPKPKEPNVLVIDLSEGTKDLIQELIKALNNQPAPVINISVPQATTSVASVAPVAAAPKPVQSPVEQPKAETPPVNSTEENTVSLTQIRELINLKAGENKTAKIVSLLGEHGAKNASSLGAEHFNVFYEKLKNL